MSDRDEKWRPVLGFEGLYEVTAEGRVRRFGSNRVKKASVDKAGRRYVRLWVGNKSHDKKIHVLVLEAFVGPRPAGMEACHWDDDPANNTLENLRWDTPGANMLDLVRNGNHVQARKTHCPRGHLLVAPNLVPSLTARGSRSCLTCSRTRARARNSPSREYDEAQAEEEYFKIMRSAKVRQRIQIDPKPF